MYDLVLPGEERPDGRPARATPLYAKLKAKGAVHTESFGWERPKWFSPDGREEAYSFRRNNVFAVIAAECKAVRERVGLFELPSFSKFDVTGPGAESFLNRLLANPVSKRVGGIVLTHALNEIGRIQTEFTITRLAADHFYLLSGATAEIRDWDLLNMAKRDDEDVIITNLTIHGTALVLAGPQARNVLNKITSADLSNRSFRWLTGKAIEVAGVPVRALRVNYVGELGWELHVQMDNVEELYTAIWDAGEEFRIADFGTYAMNSLRLEKGYPGWGVELTNEITPVEAGLDRFVKLSHDFVGKDAVLRAMDNGVAIRMVYTEVDVDDADVRGGEPVYDGDKVIGVTTSGGYGYSVNKSLAFAYVDDGYEDGGTRFEY
jgi:dimethylglycine dehydrogenase